MRRAMRQRLGSQISATAATVKRPHWAAAWPRFRPHVVDQHRTVDGSVQPLELEKASPSPRPGVAITTPRDMRSTCKHAKQVGVLDIFDLVKGAQEARAVVVIQDDELEVFPCP